MSEDQTNNKDNLPNDGGNVASPVAKASPVPAPAAKSKAPERLSRREAAMLSRAVILEETDPPSSLRSTIYGVSAFIALFIVWASLAQFDEKAIAPGEIIPQFLVQPVQHLEGGIIVDVMVEEGQRVKKGEMLMRLDDTQFRTERDGVATRFASLSMQVERLRAFVSEREPDFSGFGPVYDAIKADQIRAFDTATNNRRGRLSVLDAQIQGRQKELDGHVEKELSLGKLIVSLNEEQKIRTDLYEKGLNSKLVVLKIARDLESLMSELADTKTNHGRALASLAEARGRRLELEEELRKSALDELTSIASEAKVQGDRLEKLNGQLARTLITSPVQGSIKGLTMNRAGRVIHPGEIIFEVVPDDEKLIAEVRVSPSDIGHLSIGLAAIVKVDTYKYGRLGGIKGKVSRISATTFLDEKGNGYFKTWIALETNYVGTVEGLNRIAPGMTLVADIRTGKKSLMQYLARPITYSLDDAFSER